jgi:hypothetical protein
LRLGTQPYIGVPISPDGFQQLIPCDQRKLELAALQLALRDGWVRFDELKFVALF